MATLLFIIPNKKRKGEKLMDWNECKKLPWNIILLLGAGFAIADGVQSSGLADVLSKTLDFLEQAPYLAIAPAVCLISAIITEFITSNDATATLLLPLLIQMAKTMHVHPLLLMIPGAVGSQFAFMLPTGTPSNIVGFTTGHINIQDMIKTGLPLKIAGTAILSFLMPTLGKLFLRIPIISFFRKEMVGFIISQVLLLQVLMFLEQTEFNSCKADCDVRVVGLANIVKFIEPRCIDPAPVVYHHEMNICLAWLTMS